jgi:hypothetical protein
MNKRAVPDSALFVQSRRDDLKVAQDVSPISVNLLGVLFVKTPTKTSS